MGDMGVAAHFTFFKTIDSLKAAFCIGLLIKRFFKKTNMIAKTRKHYEAEAKINNHSCACFILRFGFDNG
jgi:hypothetical protein